MEQWIIPCNVNFYDVVGVFEKLKCVDWKQSNPLISIGDEVFIYVSKPISAILYKCKVNKANMPEATIDDSAFVLNGEKYQNYGNYMELELLEKYDNSKFALDVLTEKGLKGRIQGPRRVKELKEFLNKNK